MKIGGYEAFTTPLDGRSTPVIYRSLLANPVLRPELSREREAGLDATLIGNITLELTWYHKRTLDQLKVEYANVVGLQPYWANAASTVTDGREATIQIPLVDRPLLRANVGFTYSFNKSRVTSLGDQANTGNLVVGYPIDAEFSRRILGVSDSARARGVVFPEDIIYDTVPRYVGVTAPPRTYSITPTIQLMGGHVRLSSMIDRQSGFVRRGTGCINGLCIEPYLKSTPLLEQARFVSTSGDDLEPGDFTRWREVNVTADVPLRLVRALHFGGATVSLQGRNLALWTKQQYHGPDPESFSKIGISQTIRSSGIPQARAWSFRFDVTP